ncbi:unnamed protein product [Meloidogyne enterolobii]|uniref:Uncharacterized protein n=1 Tax=Meloidogyne enterolobii TaxID=390850 RepID=A0ACB0ZR87_MELEN
MRENVRSVGIFKYKQALDKLGYTVNFKNNFGLFSWLLVKAIEARVSYLNIRNYLSVIFMKVYGIESCKMISYRQLLNDKL